MRLISVQQKETFLNARLSGQSIRKASQLAGFSTGTGKRYERLRRSGELQKQIMEGTEPMKTQQATKILHSALEEIKERGVKNLSDKDLINLISRGPALLKTLDRTSKQEEEDELDAIWRQVSQEMEGTNQEQQATGDL